MSQCNISLLLKLLELIILLIHFNSVIHFVHMKMNQVSSVFVSLYLNVFIVSPTTPTTDSQQQSFHTNITHRLAGKMERRKCKKRPMEHMQLELLGWGGVGAEETT